MVYDKTVLTTLAAMTAAQWFANRDQVLNDNPRGIEVRDWELVPGTQLQLKALPFSHKGIGLFVFANYSGPGDHRARLDDWKNASVVLGDHTLTVAGQR